MPILCDLNEDGRIVVEKDDYLVATLPGAKQELSGWNLQGPWTLPLTWATVVQIRSIFGKDVMFGAALQKWYIEQLNTWVNPAYYFRDLVTTKDDRFPDLFPYQVAGAKFLSTVGQGILGDPCGAGKSCQSITAARMLGDKALPALVVAPKSTLYAWKAEWERWAPGIKAVVVDGDKKRLDTLFSQLSATIGMCPVHGDDNTCQANKNDGPQSQSEKQPPAIQSEKTTLEQGNAGPATTPTIQTRETSPSATQNSPTTPRGSVGTVTNKNSETGTRSLPSVNGRTLGSGWSRTQSELGTRSQNESQSVQNSQRNEGLTNDERTSPETTESPLKSMMSFSDEQTISVNFAERGQPPFSIMTTTPEEFVEFSVTPVTSPLSSLPTKSGESEPKCTCNFVVIVNWERVRKLSRMKGYGSMALSAEERREKELNQIPFKLVIADEAHKLSNPKSKQTRSVWFVAHQDTVDYRWGLTATPLTDHIDSLWPLLHFCNPEEHPSKTKFIDRYAILRQVPWGQGTEVAGMNPDHEAEFQDIFQPRFRRMPKAVILPQLPPIIRTQRRLEMSEKQAKLYQQMTDDMVAETDTGELLIAENPAVKMLRLVQFSSACVDMMPTEDEEFRVRLIDPSNKLDALMEDIPDYLAAGEPVVVFAVSRQLIEMAEKRLEKAKIPYGVIKGDQKLQDRQAMVDDFQAGKTPVMLVVIAAGGVGINLNRARIGLFLQRSFSFVEGHQSEGRLHRIGSEVHESVQFVDYVSIGTVDLTVAAIAAGKEVQLERVVKDRESVLRLLRGEEVE